MGHNRLCLLLWSIALLIGMVGAAPRPVRADTAADANIQLQAQPFFEGRYRANSWLPFRVTVANAGPDVTAVLSIQTGSTFETTVELPRGANKSVVLYAQAQGGFRRTATVRVLVGGNEAQKIEVPISGVASTTQVIGVLSPQPLTLPKPADRQNRKYELFQVTRNDLPERSEGLSLFDLLLVDGAPLTDLSAGQQQALADWVRTGGQLILGGAKLDTTLGQLAEPLRIATLGAPAPAGPISLLPELAAATPPTISAVVGTQGTRTVATAGSATVGVQGEVGKGRVTVLGFSLAAPELAQLPPEAIFWQHVVRSRSTLPEHMGGQSPDEMQTQQLGFALMTLPVLAIPPLGVLAALLGAYLLIVGPGLYLLLRRLDRQAWGWVAIPLITLVFTLGTYTYGLRLRGNDIILNQISVVEPVAGRARARTYAGLFSPRTATYAITSPSDALFKPMPAGEFHGGGVPTTTSTGRYAQGSGGVNNLNVAQWSMSTFAAEQMLDEAPLTADLTLTDGLLRGTVRNIGPDLIRDVALFQNTRVAKIGDLPPGASRPVELQLGNQPLAEWGGSLSMLLFRDKWDFNRPQQPPAEIRMQMMVLDALFNTSYDRSTEPMLLGWLDKAPIALEVNRGRIHKQQLTLITAPASIDFSQSERVQLPRGWLKSSVEASAMTGGPCMTQFGNGWYMDSGVLTSTLQLPPTLPAVQVDMATLHVHVEGPTVGPVTLDVFDWSAGQWVPQENVTNSVNLAQPDRFFSSTGLFRARLDWQNSGLMGHGGGCMSMDLSIEGTPQ